MWMPTVNCCNRALQRYSSPACAVDQITGSTVAISCFVLMHNSSFTAWKKVLFIHSFIVCLWVLGKDSKYRYISTACLDWKSTYFMQNKCVCYLGLYCVCARVCKYVHMCTHIHLYYKYTSLFWTISFKTWSVVWAPPIFFSLIPRFPMLKTLIFSFRHF